MVTERIRVVPERATAQAVAAVVGAAGGWLAQLQPAGAAYGIDGPNTHQDSALSTAWDGKTLSLVPAPALVHASESEAARQQFADLKAQLAATKNAPTAAEQAALEAIRATAKALAVEALAVEAKSSAQS